MPKILYILNKNQISLSTPDEWRPTMQRGAVLFTDNADGLSEARLRDDYGFSEVRCFADFQTTPLLEYEVCNSHAEKPFEKIITLGEFDIERAARLRTYLGIPGQSFEDGYAFRDKFLMRQRLQNAGFSCPPFAKVDHYSELDSFIKKHGLPLVFKDRWGAASKGLSFLRTKGDVEELLSKRFASGIPEGKYIVEGFVRGGMYHVDGLVVQGKLVLALPSRYVDNAANTDFRVSLCSVSLDEDSDASQQLKQLTKDLVQRAFPSKDSYVFHLEVFYDGSELTVCEIACRLGGARVKDATISRTGIDLKMLYLLGEGQGWDRAAPILAKAKTVQQCAGWAILRPQNGVLVACPTEISVEGIRQIKLKQAIGTQFNLASQSIDHYVSYVVEGANEKQLLERIKAANQEFQEKTVWKS